MRRRYQDGGSNLPPHIDIDEIGKFLYEDNYKNPYKDVGGKKKPMQRIQRPNPIHDGFRHAKPVKPRGGKAIQNLNRIRHMLQQQRKRAQALKYLQMMGGMSRLGYGGLMAAAGVGILMNTTPPLTPQQGMIGPDHYMGVGTPKYRRGGTSCRTPYRLKRRR